VLWTLTGSRAASHVVRVGITDGMLTQLTEGDVRAGDRVVSEAIVAGANAKKGP
jgi:hypothetical protein